MLKEGESLVLNALPTYVPPRSGDACRCPGGCGEGKGCNHTCRADGGKFIPGVSDLHLVKIFWRLSDKSRRKSNLSNHNIK